MLGAPSSFDGITCVCRSTNPATPGRYPRPVTDLPVGRTSASPYAPGSGSGVQPDVVGFDSGQRFGKIGRVVQGVADQAGQRIEDRGFPLFGISYLLPVVIGPTRLWHTTIPFTRWRSQPDRRVEHHSRPQRGMTTA